MIYSCAFIYFVLRPSNGARPTSAKQATVFGFGASFGRRRPIVSQALILRETSAKLVDFSLNNNLSTRISQVWFEPSLDWGLYTADQELLALHSEGNLPLFGYHYPRVKVWGGQSSSNSMIYMYALKPFEALQHKHPKNPSCLFFCLHRDLTRFHSIIF